MSGLIKRLRIIAGPNGSGKTSLYRALLELGRPNFGVSVNADEIEKDLHMKGIISFHEYGLKVENTDLHESFRSFLETRKSGIGAQDFEVNDNFLVCKSRDGLDSYFASFVSEYIRIKMINVGKSPITFETVMSHYSKLNFMDYGPQSE